LDFLAACNTTLTSSLAVPNARPTSHLLQVDNASESEYLLEVETVGWCFYIYCKRYTGQAKNRWAADKRMINQSAMVSSALLLQRPDIAENFSKP
jgi:hypothetical protein